MLIDDMEKAVEEARLTLNRADMVAAKMARILRGRLRQAKVSKWVLGDLKRELAKYNMHTGEWKD